MKKFLTICLVFSVGLNLYLINTEHVVRDDLEADLEDFERAPVVMNDKIQLAQSAIKKDSSGCDNKKTKIIKRKIKRVSKHNQAEIEDVQGNEKSFTEEEIREKLEVSYQQWLDKSENFFIEDLRLSAEQIAAYRSLSSQRQNDINAYFDQKTKGGTDTSPSAYMFTSEDTIFMGKLAQKYERQLKEAFGEKNYRKHKNFLKNHNNSAMTDEFVQVVEF